MANEPIDYTHYVDEALRGAVREILRSAGKTGLSGAQHFFISFRTDFPGASVSEALRAKYPEEITIVLQHQFRDLVVEKDGFKVVLYFNNIPEKLVVPFAALTGFADPSVRFSLQFQAKHDEAASGRAPAVERAATDEGDTDGGAEIIALDAFRKK